MPQTQKIRTLIEPGFDGPIIDNRHIRAGMFIVKTKALRNAIGVLFRKLDTETTTLAFVEADGILYKLINNPSSQTTSDTDWAPITLSSSALTPIGNWDADNTTPVLADTGAVGHTGEFYFVVGAPTSTPVTIPGLFSGTTVNVSDGNYIVSVGTRWIVVANATTWDAIAKPDVINDYVDGEVISHTHEASDISDLGTFLDDYLQQSQIADDTIAFGSVPDTAIVDKQFLITHYYTAEEVDDLIDEITGGGGGGGASDFTDLGDVPSSYTGHQGKAVYVNGDGDGLEFLTSKLASHMFTESIIFETTDDFGFTLESSSNEDTPRTRFTFFPEIGIGHSIYDALTGGSTITNPNRWNALIASSLTIKKIEMQIAVPGIVITDTISNLGLLGAADFSANYSANSYVQKVHTDKTDVRTPKIVILPGDVTNNNATPDTLQDVTGLQIPITINRKYWFRFFIPFTTPSSATGSRWTINGPAITHLSYEARYSNTSSGYTTGLRNTYDSTILATASSTNGNQAIIEGTIQCSAAGNLVARFSSEIAGSAVIARGGFSFVQYLDITDL